MTRLERFRQFVAAMDPASPIDRATGNAWHVDQDPRDAIIDAICSPLELMPTRRALVVGCTGAGKTTLIRRCVERIRATVKETGDRAQYVDVSEHHRMDTEGLEGVLIAIAGEQLGRPQRKAIRLPKDSGETFHKAAITLKEHARGKVEWIANDSEYDDRDDNDRPDDEPRQGYFAVHRAALRAPPQPPQPGRFSKLVAPLKTLRTLRIGETSHLILAFDSLDRLSDPARFGDAVKEDLPVLAAAGIGTIVVGPVRYSLGTDRSIHDLFDAVHVVPTIGTSSAAGSDFLCRVLEARDIANILPKDLLPQLADASGGILRDLISLARRAGEEAYAKGHDPVTQEDFKTAVSALGDALAFGIDDADLRVLRALDDKGEFVIRGERELALVDHRRVLNLGTGVWRIHPALVPKLRAIPKEAA